MKWIYLLIAIVGELVGTTSLKESVGFTKLGPSVITVLSYGVTFYFLSLALREIPVGVAYAIWAGAGILLVAIIGYVRFNQKLDAAAIIGMALIILGVCVMQLFSKTISH